MKQRLLLSLLCAILLAAGCSSQPARVGGIGGSSGPEILLPGGGIEEAQLLAMGMARSKGWTIVETDDRSFLLERVLPEGSPQAQMLNPQGMLSRPKLQVETRLRPRGSDILVGLSAYIVVDPGTEQERRVDYTTDYQDQLMISLNALASAWLENRSRIASEIPLPPDPDQVAIAEAGAADDSNQPANDSTGATVDAPAEPSSDVATMAAVARPVSLPPAQPSPLPTGDTRAQALTPLGAIETSVEQDVGDATTASESNEMLVLDGQARRRGLWTFYAEASARERGCEVGERGASLLSTSTAFELYEVPCVGSPNLLLRCQGGVCREIN